VVKHLRWVPHTLTPTQKTERATLSIKLLRQLRSIESHGWQFIIAHIKSWFYRVFHPNRALLIVCRKLEPWLVKGDNELPTLAFNGPELAQELN
jgi:hypothetical protein